MTITWSKLLALLIAIACAVLYINTHMAGVNLLSPHFIVLTLEASAGLAIPVVLIWFPEQIGAATGFFGHGSVDTETPPGLVAFMGWFLLIGLPLVVQFVLKSS